MRFSIFQLRRWINLDFNSQSMVIATIYLYLRGFISQKVFTKIITRIINSVYKREDSLIEAENLYKLPEHLLLGLLIYLKQKLCLTMNKEIGSNVELMKIVNYINTSKLIDKLGDVEKDYAKEFLHRVNIDLENDYFVCEIGINMLKSYELFSKFTTNERIHNIKPMLEVLNIIKKVTPEIKQRKKLLHVRTLSNTKKNIIKCKVQNYNIDLPTKNTIGQISTPNISRADNNKKLFMNIKKSRSSFHNSSNIFFNDVERTPLSLIVTKDDKDNGKRITNEEKNMQKNDPNYFSCQNL